MPPVYRTPRLNCWTLRDHLFFWNAIDLTQKLDAFADYYNAHRVHRSLDGTTPAQRAGSVMGPRSK